MAQTPREAADIVYAAMPHSITPELLSDYGLDVTQDQARHIAQELLSLNLPLDRERLAGESFARGNRAHGGCVKAAA